MTNSTKVFTTLSLTLLLWSSAHGQIDGDEELMAKRGNGTVTHEEFNARANRIPDDRRFRVLRDRGRMEDILNNMLMLSQLAADAEEAGFEQQTIVQQRMELAAREELAKAWLEHYTSVENKANFTAMAREQWTLNKERYRTEDLVDVTHILVGSETRSEEEALEIAQDLAAQIAGDPTLFDALVLEYSDDPSAGSNKGSFRNVKKGDMVASFEKAAFSMKVGEISEPVLTPYGYHLIRLDKISPARQKSFAEVRVQLEEQAREKHRERVQTQYLTEIYKPELQVTKESMENALERVFGPEILAKYADEPETE